MVPWRERFIDEYIQLSKRIIKLSAMLAKYRDGKLDFNPISSIELLDRQLQAMLEYQKCLKMRSLIEDIELPGISFWELR